MWMYRLLIRDGQVQDADCLNNVALSTTNEPILSARALLAHLQADEDREDRDAYRSLLCFALRLDDVRACGVVNVLHPVLDLTLDEQSTIRSWLIAQRWPAWARADLSVRRLLGSVDPPILLAEAARHWMIPIQTLAKAALDERLPTIRIGDRQLVYLSTITEAQQRGLLHHGPGRPRR